MSGHRERAELFKQAVLWLEEKGGEDAVMRAFGNPEPLEAAWQLEISEFRGAEKRRYEDAGGHYRTVDTRS